MACSIAAGERDSSYFPHQRLLAATTHNDLANERHRADVAALQARGVVFEEYDLPGLKTVNGVATIGESKGAWFKDSEGNLLALGQFD